MIARIEQGIRSGEHRSAPESVSEIQVDENEVKNGIALSETASIDELVVDEVVLLQSPDGSSREVEVEMIWPESNRVTVSWLKNSKREILNVPLERISKIAGGVPGTEAIVSIEVATPEEIRVSIQKNLFLTENARMTALSLLDNYIRMQSEGASESKLDAMMVSIEDTLNTPTDVDTVFKVMKEIPAISGVDNQTIESMYDMYNNCLLYTSDAADE